MLTCCKLIPLKAFSNTIVKYGETDIARKTPTNPVFPRHDYRPESLLNIDAPIVFVAYLVLCSLLRQLPAGLEGSPQPVVGIGDRSPFTLCAAEEPTEDHLLGGNLQRIRHHRGG